MFHWYVLKFLLDNNACKERGLEPSPQKVLFENFDIKKVRINAPYITAEIKKVSTYADVEDCINTIKAVAQKYKLIFYHSHDNFHYIDLNIQTVFEKAWIDKL